MRPICRKLFTVGFLCLLTLMVSGLQAADHLEAPGVMGRGAVDINDLYIFESLENSANAVMILTVNPFAGNVSGTDFDSGTGLGGAGSGASYQFQIDNTGNGASDLIYTASFTAAVGGVQTMTLQRNGAVIGAGITGATFNTANGGQAQFGVYDDPFFFDLNGFNNGFAFTGDDTLAGANVSAIVFELPKSDFGANNVGAIAVTEVDGARVDRMGRPAVNTALIASGRKDDFNMGDPEDDFANFGTEVNAAIAGLSNQANADALTPILLPDRLTYDSTMASGFLNGRRLQDDVIDASLNLLTAGAVTGDGVDANDVAFRNVFPYLAAQQVAAVPEPGSTGVLLFAGVGFLLRRRRRSI